VGLHRWQWILLDLVRTPPVIPSQENRWEILKRTMKAKEGEITSISKLWWACVSDRGNGPIYYWPPIQILIAMADGKIQAKPLNPYAFGRGFPANRTKQGWIIQEA
jgi:hypothetical protein